MRPHHSRVAQKPIRRITARGMWRMSSITQRQMRRRVDHRPAAVDRADHVARHAVRLSRKWRRLQAGGHARAHEAGLDAHGSQPVPAEPVVQPFEVGGQPRLGGAVDHHRRPPPVARHRREHAERAPVGGQQAPPRVLAEADGVSEVHRGEVTRLLRIGFQHLLRGEARRGHDDGVEAAQRGRRRVEGAPEGLGAHQGRIPPWPAAFRQPAPRSQIACRPIELGGVPAQQADGVAALHEQAGHRPPHPPRGAQHRGPHAGSPSTRTDCALRSRSVGSHRRRTAVQRSRRGSIARKCAGRVNASLAR